MPTRICRADRVATLARAWVLPLALTACLCGCGSSDDGTTPAVHVHLKKAPPKVQKPPVTGEIPVAEMVAAVSATKSGPPVTLKFDLPQRPQVGQPLEVELALIPDSPNIDRLQARFQAQEGLELVSGAEAPAVEKPAEGLPIRHTVRILPKRDGIFTLTAVVAVNLGGQSVSRTFAVPMIAGQGLAELAAKSEIDEGQVAAAHAARVSSQ